MNGCVVVVECQTYHIYMGKVTFWPITRLKFKILTLFVATSFENFSITDKETACAYYTFAISDVQENGDQFLRCREGYVGADGVLAHLENVGDLLDEMIGKTVDVHSAEVIGPKDDVAKLKEPLKDFNPMYFELEAGGLDTTNAGASE